ncbi:hypothetical protein DVH21_28695 [Micromonospora aurantiaca]|uniref:Uncharacterized protein n=1 Tax=Micromonospora aurantiaca (nom. illeg.) TaxID=47850 RepID=A0A6N3K6H0_9ACTN|nr:hypothetical protein DVH21_28695 [Micromonospora aurantiaca]
MSMGAVEVDEAVICPGMAFIMASVDRSTVQVTVTVTEPPRCHRLVSTATTSLAQVIDRPARSFSAACWPAAVAAVELRCRDAARAAEAEADSRSRREVASWKAAATTTIASSMHGRKKPATSTDHAPRSPRTADATVRRHPTVVGRWDI